MKIVCPSCNTFNDTTNKTCISCTHELSFNLGSNFQLDNGQILSIVELLGKVQQLEKRLVYIEENYQPTKVNIVEEVIEAPKTALPVFSVPRTLPTALKELKELLGEVNEAKQKAKNQGDHARFTDLDFDSKKIEKRIQRLEQEEQTPQPQIEQKTKNIVEDYPKTIAELKKALEDIVTQKELANLNRDLKGLEVLLTRERELEQDLKKQELAEAYGKKEEEDSVENIEKEGVKEALNVNKNLIFEIEQELATVWSAKQRAQITQDVVRYGLLTDKERRLKKELAMAERGEIQSRISQPKTKTPSEETKIVPSTSTVAKKVQRPPVATKVIKPKKQGPTAAEQFFAPLISAVSFVENKYNEYKREGKLSMFFLTVAGIVTLLFGFGFLAQYSAVTYFGDYLTQIKVGFGFICSCTAIFTGTRLIKKDKKFAEFGQALMGLGLSLNYLFIYFLSADPPLISSSIGFVLIFLNTAVSIVLSLRYESKIIAVLALLGGALAPSYLQSTGENTHIYFAYLWLLCAASAYTAKRLTWEVLNFISFLLVTLILGRSTYFQYSDPKGLSDFMYLLLFHAFAYLYAYVSLFDGLKPREKQSSMSLITLIGAQGAMMLSLYFVYGIEQQAYATLSVAYLLNMLPFVVITILFYQQWSEQQKSILVGIASAFVAAAIPAYFGVEYRGLLWALQGIVLLSGGLIFKLASVRSLAYFILIGGIVNMSFNLDWYSMPDRTIGVLFTTGYINLWSVGIVLIVVSVLLKKYETVLKNHEQNVPVVLNEILSIWGLSIFYITTYFFCGNYAYNLALIPMFALLVWNNYRKLYLAEILGLGQVFMLVFVVLMSMDRVGSYHFSDQLLYGQLGMVEILFVLWFLELFYEKVLPEAPAYKHKMAKKAREVAYFILPLALLDAFNNRLPAYLLYGFWIATGLAFALVEFTKSKLVLVEFLGLTALSIFLSCISVQAGPLVVGNVLLLGIGFYKKAWTEKAFEKADYQMVYLVTPYFFAVSAGLIYFVLSGERDAFSGMQLLALILLTMVNLAIHLEPIKRTLNIAYRLAWGASFLALLVILAYLNDGGSISSRYIVGFIFLIGVLAWSHKMIYKADIPYKGNQQSMLWQTESVVLHLLNILAYVTLLAWMTGDTGSIALTIALFVHGIALVFNGLLPNYAHLNKVYIPLFAIAMIKLFLVDMKDAETIMKIIVFIIVGVICLLAAYFLIKYNDKNKPAVVAEENKETSNTIQENDSTDTNELG